MEPSLESIDLVTCLKLAGAQNLELAFIEARVKEASAEANMAAFRIMSEPRRGTQVELRFPPERVQEVKEGSSDATAATG